MLYNQERRILESIEDLKRKIHTMGTTVNAGLAALQQAQTDTAAAVTANTAAVNQIVTAYADQAKQIATLQGQVSALNTEDPEVQALAAGLETLAQTTAANTAALTAALPPAPAPAA